MLADQSEAQLLAECVQRDWNERLVHQTLDCESQLFFIFAVYHQNIKFKFSCEQVLCLWIYVFTHPQLWPRTRRPSSNWVSLRKLELTISPPCSQIILGFNVKFVRCKTKELLLALSTFLESDHETFENNDHFFVCTFFCFAFCFVSF